MRWRPSSSTGWPPATGSGYRSCPGRSRRCAGSAPAVLIETVLESSGLRPCFQVTMSTEQVARGKPAPDIYLAVAARLGCSPPDCAAVEDSSNGLRSAAAAGLRVIAIPHPQYPPDPDALAAASLVLPTLADLTADAVGALT